MNADVLIIGGGLSGLSCALQCEQRGIDWQLIEARDRFGGRILSVQDEAGAAYDLGPAWFWPGQPRMDALMRRLGLERFEQYSKGKLVFEDPAGKIQRDYEFATMAGSYRVVGGLGLLIKRLVEQLPSDRLHLKTGAQGIRRKDNRVEVEGSRQDQSWNSQHVILALPPRLAAEKISFGDQLPTGALSAMRGVPTWMAGQAKIIALYDKPFWREAGLNGDAISHLGPMAEIHDASPENGKSYALFGFVSAPVTARKNQAETIKEASLAQLVRLFGEYAALPRQLILKDWAFDPETSVDLDHTPLKDHPDYKLPTKLSELWDNSIILAGTETGREFGGYLEGALEAADAAISKLSI